MENAPYLHRRWITPEQLRRIRDMVQDARQVLEALGIAVIKEDQTHLWAYSPFRKETKPSFHIRKSDLVWFDFGEWRGHDWLNLVKKVKNLPDIYAAGQWVLDCGLRSVGDTDIDADASGEKLAAQEMKEKIAGLQIVRVKALQNKALLAYLRERGIDIEIAKRYLREIYYQITDTTGAVKNYFGLCLQNDGGGFEVRNKYFKGCIGGAKDVTGINLKGQSKLAIFEGLLDFLAAMTYYRKQAVESGVLILNSIALKDRAVEVIKRGNFESVALFLDNDEKGRAGRRYIEERTEGRCVDRSGVYAGFKDFNEFLMKSGSVQY